jgi:hypothetical protein
MDHEKQSNEQVKLSTEDQAEATGLVEERLTVEIPTEIQAGRGYNCKFAAA